jgi:hypothetical protein
LARAYVKYFLKTIIPCFRCAFIVHHHIGGLEIDMSGLQTI